MSNIAYHSVDPQTTRLPILLSIAHSGTEFPEMMKEALCPEWLAVPIDTDWNLPELYDFAPQIGVTVLQARYSRYVVDLNRDPENNPLYTDGRRESEVVPTQTSEGENLYRHHSAGSKEQADRLQRFYWPYYHRIEELIDSLRTEFAHVVLFDAHSIRSFVPTIRPEPFPDLTLGDNNGKSCDPSLSKAAIRILTRTGGYHFAHNFPFRGGHITRHFGCRTKKVHALQLVMSQSIYMDETNRALLRSEVPAVKELLQDTLLAVAEAARALP